MITIGRSGRGGRALANHVSNVEENETVEEGPSRGLVTAGARRQVMELSALGDHARSKNIVYHVSASPAEGGVDWTPAQTERFWLNFEREFGLERQPFASQIHVKKGRRHEHREYLLARTGGTVVPLKHDFVRREKLSRIAEFDAGHKLVAGRHNRAVAAALEREGRPDIAAAMKAQGLLDRRRPRAKLTPAERQQAERTAIDPAKVRADALAAWSSTATGPEFQRALEQRGLQLAQGDKVVVLIDATGNAHPLARTIGSASAAEGQRIRAAEVKARVSGLQLRPLQEAAPQAPALEAETPAPADDPAPQATVKVPVAEARRATERWLAKRGDAARRARAALPPRPTLESIGAALTRRSRNTVTEARERLKAVKAAAEMDRPDAADWLTSPIASARTAATHRANIEAVKLELKDAEVELAKRERWLASPSGQAKAKAALDEATARWHRQANAKGRDRKWLARTGQVAAKAEKFVAEARKVERADGPAAQVEATVENGRTQPRRRAVAAAVSSRAATTQRLIAHARHATGLDAASKLKPRSVLRAILTP